MKTVGKIATLATSLSLSFVLAACGGNESTPSVTPIANSTSSSTPTSSTSSASPSSSSSSDRSSVLTSSTFDPSKSTSYENEAFAISYTPPEGWSFSDTGTLSKANPLIKVLIKALRGYTTIDMVAANADNTSSMILSIVNRKVTNASKSASKLLETQAKELQKRLESDYSCTSNEMKVKFEGATQEIPVIVTTVTKDDKGLAIGQAVIEKDGHYLNLVSFGTTQEDVVNSFSGFKSTV